jgi:hypothetical protein
LDLLGLGVSGLCFRSQMVRETNIPDNCNLWSPRAWARPEQFFLAPASSHSVEGQLPISRISCVMVWEKSNQHVSWRFDV